MANLKLEERRYPRRDFALESDEIYRDQAIDFQENAKLQLQHFQDVGDPEMASELLNRILPALEGKVIMGNLRPDVVLVLRDGWPDFRGGSLNASRTNGTMLSVQMASSERFGQLKRGINDLSQTLAFVASNRLDNSDILDLHNDPAHSVLENLPETVAIRLADRQHLCITACGTREMSRRPVQLHPREIGNLNQKFILAQDDGTATVPVDNTVVRIMLAENADYDAFGRLTVFSDARGKSCCLTIEGSPGGSQRIVVAKCQRGDPNQEFIINKDSQCIESRQGRGRHSIAVMNLEAGAEVELAENLEGPENRFLITEHMLYVHQEILSRNSPLLKQLEDVELPGTFKRLAHGSVCLDLRELRKIGDRNELSPPQAREEQLARIQDALHVFYNPEEAICTYFSGVHFDWTSNYSPYKEHHRGDALNGVFHFLAWANVEHTQILRRIHTMLDKYPSIGCLKLARKYGYERRPPDQYLLDLDRFLLHTFSGFEANELKRFRDYEDARVNGHEYKGLDKQTKLDIHERRIRSLEHLVGNLTEEEVKRVRSAKTRPGLGFTSPAQVFSKTQFRDRDENKLVPIPIKGGYQ